MAARLQNLVLIITMLWTHPVKIWSCLHS